MCGLRRWWFIEFRARYKQFDRWKPWGVWEEYRHNWTDDAGPQLFNRYRQAVAHARQYCYRNSSLISHVSPKTKRYSNQVDYRIRSVKVQK